MPDPLDTAATPTEWGTFALIIGCYGAWGGAVFGVAGWSVWTAMPLVILTAVLHSSLTHEVLHGHPFQSRTLNEALMALPLSLAIPYTRFRDLHLAHHQDSNLTDPYDDPESNFLDPTVWAAMSRLKRRLCAANNTLLGRIVLGPMLGQISFMQDEMRLARRGERAIWVGWALHLPGVAVVLWLVVASPMPVWAFLVSTYAALGVLKIRTFLEHQAHEKVRGRSVIIEDRGLLAFLFLNNNLHVVHHMNPRAAWYQLPALYRARKTRYLEINEGYVFRSYTDVFRRYFLTAKDPVPHPHWSAE